MFNWNFFLIISAVNALVLIWVYWRYKYQHAVFRFFAFECILGLIMLVNDKWFLNPSAFHQVISWIFLVVSMVFVIIGISHLMTRGASKGNFENTTPLVVHGIYEFVRHPIYTALIFLGMGAFIKDMNWFNFLLLAAYLVSIVLTAKSEEKGLSAKFGHEYDLYMARTKMFIPFLL